MEKQLDQHQQRAHCDTRCDKGNDDRLDYYVRAAQVLLNPGLQRIGKLNFAV